MLTVELQHSSEPPIRYVLFTVLICCHHSELKPIFFVLISSSSLRIYQHLLSLCKQDKTPLKWNIITCIKYENNIRSEEHTHCLASDSHTSGGGIYYKNNNNNIPPFKATHLFVVYIWLIHCVLKHCVNIIWIISIAFQNCCFIYYFRSNY